MKKDILVGWKVLAKSDWFNSELSGEVWFLEWEENLGQGKTP